MKQRLLALLLALVMVVGVVPTLGQAVSAAEETEKAEEKAETKAEEKAEEKSEEKTEEKAEAEGTVLIDWNCDKLDPEIVTLSGSKYPAYYFADSSTEGVEEGTVYMGGDANPTGYATLIFEREMTTPAFTLEMDMKVDSIMTQVANTMYRGVIIEFHLPKNKQMYIILQDMVEDEEGNKTATLRVANKDRASDNAYVETITIPNDDEFHKWAFQYDGIDMLRFTIDGEVIKDFPEVDVFHDGTVSGRLQIKNIMADMSTTSLKNSITFDNIKLTEGTKLNYNKVESVSIATDANAEKFTLTTKVNNLDEDGELSVTVYPRGDEDKAVTKTYKPEEKTSTTVLEDLPFTGVCTVIVNYTGAQPYQFDYFLYKSYDKIEKDAKIKAEGDNEAYVFYDLADVKLPEDSVWYTVEYKTANTEGSALFAPAVGDAHSFDIPVKMTGKYAVYVGYVVGTKQITVNDVTAEITTPSMAAASSIHEAYVTAVDLSGEGVTVSNAPFALAQIAYVKFLSLSDEMYELALKEDDSHTFTTDNDGFSTLCSKGQGNYKNLFNNDFMTPYKKIDQRQFIWCMFSTSILNYDSEVWWEYVTKRLKELNIPEEKWPEDFLDHVDVNGKHLDFDHIMRDIDKIAYDNMRSLNEEGYPHEILSNMVAENIEGGEFYASLRMSHFSSGGSSSGYQSGSFFHLHPEWKREGGPQFSYIYEEYRNYVHDILIEMAQPENVTGILMDYGRYYYIFGDELPYDGKTEDGKTRTDIVNEFIKSVRDDLPEGKKLTVRVLNPTYEKATIWGLDYKHWVEQGWVDRVYISDQSHETFFDFDEYIEYFEEHPEVEFYLGVNATLSGHDLTKEEEEIKKAGGVIQKGERVDATTLMLRIYDFYNAGADGVFLFNSPVNTNPLYKNMNNATMMKQWYNFDYPTTLLAAPVAQFTDEGGERIIFDYNCDSLTSSLVKCSGNAYPDFYFADHDLDENIPEGQLYIGGEAKEKTGYATLSIPTTGVGKAYTLKMDLNVESIMKPSQMPTWRGLIFEIINPNAPLVYFTLNGEGDGKASIHLSKKNRAGDDVVKTFDYPTDGKFHTWTVDFDGKDTVTISIDDKEILKESGIAAKPSKEASTIEIKNMMADIGSGHNSIYIDNISMISFVEASVTGSIEEEKEEKEEEKEAAAVETPTLEGGKAAKATVERRAEVLTLPVSDADWAKATTIEKSENAKNYGSYGKEATVSYKYNKDTKVLQLLVTYNLNSWLGKLVITDGYGNALKVTSDRQWGESKAGGTLWSFHYAENGNASATKALLLNVEGVTELPKKLVLFASNCGTQTFYTAKITIDLSADPAATDTPLEAAKPEDIEKPAETTKPAETEAPVKNEIPLPTGTAAKATVETRAEIVKLPASDADWKKAKTIEKADNPKSYNAHGTEATVVYNFDEAKKTLTVHVTYNLNSWLGKVALTDANGKEVKFTSDRSFGGTTADDTLWSFHYAENTSSPAAVKTFTFTVENVTKLPDKYVFYASNMGTQTFFTAKITIDF